MKHCAQWLLALLFLSPYPACAETESAPAANLGSSIRGLQFSIRDLDFKVEDLGGKVQNLELKETPTEIRIELAADVLFDFDKATLLPKAQEALKQAAAVIRDKAKGTVRIDGYTDARGSAAYNQRLSEQRANAVRDWFVRREGLTGVRFTTQGFGAGNPVAPNTHADGSDNPEGRRKNRRVEITLRK
jgi:outer membrane protein OmpA-like peptidoglycan-associated protein